MDFLGGESSRQWRVAILAGVWILVLGTARLPLNLGNREEHIWPFGDPLGLSWFFLARLDSQLAGQQPENLKVVATRAQVP